MGTIPAPQIAEISAQGAMIPSTVAAEYSRAAALQQQTAATKQAMAEKQIQMEMQQRQLQDQDAYTRALQEWSQSGRSGQSATAPSTQQPTNMTGAPAGAQPIPLAKPGEGMSNVQPIPNAVPGQVQPQPLSAGSAPPPQKSSGSLDPQDLAGLVLKHGGSAQAAMSAMQGIIAQKQALSKLTDDQLAQESKYADLRAGIADAVNNATGPDARQTAWAQGMQSLMRAGDRSVMGAPVQVPPQEEIGKYLPILQTHSAMIAQEQKDRETTAKETEAQAAQTKAEQGNWEKFPELGLLYNTQTKQSVPVSGGTLTPPMMESKYVQLQQQKAQGQPLSSSDQAFVQGYERYKTLVPAFNFNLQNSGAAADSGGNPSAIAQAIANGSMAWKDAVSPRTPMATKNAILSHVFKLNPSFDTAEFGLEQDAAKKARSGAWADTRLAYNTAIDHADQLSKAAAALGNGDVRALNSMKNFFKTEFGSPDVPTFAAIANAYNHEVTSVVSKGHITDAEVQSGHAVMPDNASPDQIRSAADAFKGLMTSKRDELDKIIKAGAVNKANAMLNVHSGSTPAAQTGTFSWDNMPEHK